LRSFRLHAGFPSVTLSSLFLPQWYEGRPGPEYSWQSTGSTNEFEPKMGLMPLITSTLKATFYSLLFGVPIALLAALFTSEFLSARVKVPIKSTIEVMASLPSVVLGFLAALVIAPFAQGTVSAILLSFLAVPVMLLVGAYLWQLLPHATALRLGAGLRFAAMGIAVVAGIALAAALGPSVEKALFWVAAAQEDVTFQASLDQTPPATPPADQTLDDPDVATALRLHAGAPIPEATAGEARRRLERLQRAPVVFHDATWNRRYRPGRDFVLEDLDSSDAAPVPLGAPLLVHRPPGSRIREVTDADTEAERAAKALYVAVGRKPDFEGWLAGRARGPATGGWVLLLLPLSAVVMLVVMGRWVRPWLRKRTVGLGRREVALLDLARYLAGGAATLLLALGLARGFAALGWDLRGNLLGTYVQRNALVVGFVMGFAIIPIIYTLAEDALSSVPSHLREGSLGAGATPWQTATRIVVPTSMSGLFSAVMIGLGRAVGETMIVLMAAGNTPIMDWNPFNGMRTLAANIATELPEADRSSPHYRILFLCALVLFAMTFVVNTFAEAVRIRFRKRTHQL
jgi:ABC-type uncharacterized transport system permease subunit